MDHGLVHLDDVPAREHEVGELRASRRRLAAAARGGSSPTHPGIGASEWVLPPGARSTPPHQHADEEELFFVTAGSGLSWQDGRTFAVSAGDCLLHRTDDPPHTLVAGPEGLSVLVFSEGSPTRLTLLPRTGQFWAGPRWLPTDSPQPFAAEAALPPLEVPAPEDARPPTIVSLADVPGQRHLRAGYGGLDRDLGRAAGRRSTGLHHVALDPGALSCPPHWHTAEEECFLVLDGDGEALLGDERLPLRAGSFLLREPGTGVPHALRAGSGGMTYLVFGTHRPHDLAVRPRSGTLVLGGLVFRAEPVDPWVGEPS